MASFLKRKEKGSATAKKTQTIGIGEIDPVFFKKYPAISEFLSLEEWEPGVERVRGTITVFWEEGSFKSSVNDRDSEQVAFVSKGTFQGVLDAIEKGLQGDSLDWRGGRGKGQGKGKKT